MKPGFRTTEFWLTLAAMVVGSIYASGAVESDSALRILGLVSGVLGALGYTVSRGMVKQTTAQANAVIEANKLPKP